MSPAALRVGIIRRSLFGQKCLPVRCCLHGGGIISGRRACNISIDLWGFILNLNHTNERKNRGVGMRVRSKGGSNMGVGMRVGSREGRKKGV